MRLGINLVTASGMQPITSSAKLLERCRELNKPGCVLYIADFDPAGDVMPRAVARQLEFDRERDYPDVQISLTPVALVLEQVVALKLPLIPIKTSDKRADRFEEHYGTGAAKVLAK